MIEQKLNKFVEIAKALQPNNHGVKTFHVTFILNKNKILSIGINNPKTHPKTLKYDYWDDVGVHSELSAVIKLGKEDCSNYTFINIRLKKDGTVASSKPCRGCQDMLNQIGFKKIFFTNDLGKFENV